LVLAVLLCWWSHLAGSQGVAWAILSVESLQAVILWIEFTQLRNRQALAAGRSW
jgi:hypothetical protein